MAGWCELQPEKSLIPNRITQSLVAILAGLQIPFICTDTHELGEELVASYLYQVHLYHWLESKVTAEPLPAMISDLELLERNPKTMAAASVFALTNEVFLRKTGIAAIPLFYNPEP